MTRFGLWPWYGLLLALGLGLGLAARGDETISNVPRASNPGPRGIKVLITWLSELGADVRVETVPLTQLKTDVATVVMAAPSASWVDANELAALQTFVRQGGTLVLLTPRTGLRGPLRPFLQLRDAPAIPPSPITDDPTGASIAVVHARGALSGIHTLRVSADPPVVVDRVDAISMTSPPAVFWFPLGRGHIYVAAGSDLAENARLPLEGNGQFWLNLAQNGPMWFDESHHQSKTNDVASLNVWPTVLQFIWVGLVFVFAQGRRLGRLAPEPRATPPSTLDYVDAMASVTERARVGPQLIENTLRHVRRLLSERLSIPLSVTDHERIVQLTLALKMEPSQARALFLSNDFLVMSQALSHLEAQLDGRSRETLES